MRNGNPAEGNLSRPFASEGVSTPRDALFASLKDWYISEKRWARLRDR